MKSEVTLDVDSYIADFPDNVQVILNKVRSQIKQVAPEAIESIAYGMPGYKFNGKPVAYFGGYKKHIGFYATPHAHENFAERLAPYKQGKGSVQFPLNQEIPYDLIKDMVAFNVRQLS